MADTEISIELETEQRTFNPGEKIRGLVKVRSTSRARCRRLTIAAAWTTTCPVRDGARVAEQTLFQGEWKSGGDATYPFELTAPPGPFTFEGELFSIEWALTATAVLAWARNVTTSRELELRPRPGGELVPHTGGYRDAPSVSVSDTFTPPATAPRLAYVDYTLPFGGVARSIGKSLKNAWARMRLGERPAIHAPALARAGERCELRVLAGPNCDSVQARISAHETVMTREMPSATLPRYETERTLAHFDMVDATRDDDGWLIAFALPPSAPATFVSRTAQVQWEVEIECRSGGSTWTRALPLTVVTSGSA